MDPHSDLIAIREEVAALRQLIADWQPRWERLEKLVEFTPATEGVPEKLVLRCQTLRIERPGAEGDALVEVSAQKSGGRICLWGHGETAVLELGSNGRDAGEVIVFDRAGNRRVELGVAADGDAHAVVFRHGGAPGALLKGRAKESAVTVTGSDGVPRAAMLAHEDGTGEVSVALTGTGPVATMHAKKEGGLFVASRYQTGQRAALGVMGEGVTMMLVSGEDTPMAAMFAKDDMASMRMEAHRDGKPEISMFVQRNLASFAARDANNGDCWSLLAGPKGKHFTLGGTEAEAQVSLLTTAMGGAVAVGDVKGREVAKLIATEGGALFTMKAPDKEGLEDGLAFNVDGKGSSLFMHEAGRQLVEVHGSQGASVVTLRAADETKPMVQLSSNNDTQFVAVRSADDAALAGMGATAAGGSFSLHNDLGILRAQLAVADDGGLLRLNWGGTTGVTALATQVGGVVAVYDPEGERLDSLPPKDDADDGDEDDE